jgi:pilus assembly protein CpaC
MRRQRSLFAGIVLLLGMMIMTVPVAAAESLSVAVNQSRLLNFSGLQRVAIANPEIADVAIVSGTELLLLGKTPGITTLHVWSAEGRYTYLVEVAADDVPIANEIKAILGFRDIRVSKVAKNIILEGTVNDQYQKNRAEKVASAYGEKVINLLEITRPVQVKIEVKIIEIDRNKQKNLGITWGNDAGTSPGLFAFGQGSVNSFVSDSVLGGLNKYNPVNAQLNALLQNGAAKILSQPSVITVSGETANIMVGGQIPVPTSVQNGQIAIEWKDYGIKLDIAPEVNAEGLINSKVKAEVSSLDWDSTHQIELGAGMQIPPIKMNKAETVVALSSGQTMAIGGLISSQTTEDITKIPFLADIPVLGNLFKSKSFARSETELIILITPTIVDPAEYLPSVTADMKDLAAKNPWGGMNDGEKDQGTHR